MDKTGKLRRLVQEYLERLWGRSEPELPEDPYSYVGAPKKPRPPTRRATAVAEPPEE